MWLDISRTCPSSPCAWTRAAAGIGGEVFGGSHPRLGARRGRPAVAAATLGARTSSPAASVRAAACWPASYVARGAGGSRAAASPCPTARGRAASSSMPVDRPDAWTPGRAAGGGKTKTRLGDLGGRRSPFAYQHHGAPAREGLCRRQDRDGEQRRSREEGEIGDWGWPSTGPGTSWVLLGLDGTNAIRGLLGSLAGLGWPNFFSRF
jgi:hypothetical protein